MTIRTVPGVVPGGPGRRAVPGDHAQASRQGTVAGALSTGGRRRTTRSMRISGVIYLSIYVS